MTRSRPTLGCATLTVAALLLSAATANARAAEDARPERTTGVEAADCSALETRIAKQRCERLQRTQQVPDKQGSLGDKMQQDTAQASSLNRRSPG